MSPKLLLSRLQQLVRQLTTPSTQIKENNQRQQTRILASLALVILLASLIIMPIWVLITPIYPTARYISLGIILAFFAAYGLSRTRFYLAGASLLTFSILGALYIMYITGPGSLTERMLVLKYLIVVVLIASLFSLELTLLVFLIGLSVIVSFFFIPEAPGSVTYSYLVFYLVVSSLGAAYIEINGRQKRRLLESEEKYRSLVAALSEGIVLQTQAGVIEACNTAAEQILGLTAEQMMGRKSVDPRWQAIHEDGSPFPGEEHPAMITLRTGQPLKNVIMGVYQPDGQLRWISINSQPLNEPDAALPYAVVTSFADITDRKRSERAIKEAQHRYHALFEQAHDAVFILNLQGQHVEANQRAAQLLGYSVAEIQDLYFLDLSAEPPQSEDAKQKLLAGEYLPVYERMFRKKDGSLIPVEINVELVRDMDGNPLHIQSVVRDITERKRTQQRELALTLEKERTQMLTTFIQNASHEFRTPLTIIETTAFVMARLQNANERLQRVNVIHDQIKRLVKLINTLLIITKLENESAQYRLWVDIGEVLAAVHRRMKAQYPPTLTLHLAGPTDLPAVWGDPDELKEALWQIVDNACRFSAKDGVITAVTGTTDQHLWLDIRDAGPGILAENLTHIFEIFWREDEAHSTPGFGLGLAIANRIIQAHNGKIQVTSEPQIGTTVRILLPLAQNSGTQLN